MFAVFFCAFNQLQVGLFSRTIIVIICVVLYINTTVRLPYPRSQSSETFLAFSADQQTCSSDKECSNHQIIVGYRLSVADTLKEVLAKTYFTLDFLLPSDKTFICRFGKTLFYGIIQACSKTLPERLTIGLILPHERFATSIMGKRAGIIVFAASIQIQSANSWIFQPVDVNTVIT